MMAVSDRTFRSKSVPPSISSVTPSLERPPLYKKSYEEDNLRRVYEEVREGQLSIRHAAEQYHVPKSTLNDRVTGRVKLDAHSGPSHYLTDREEDELVGFICHCAKAGYAKTRKEVLAIVEEITTSKGNPTRL